MKFSSTNLNESSRMAKNLCKIFNLSGQMTMKIMKLMSKSIIHSVAEDSLSRDGKLLQFEIEIPYIGTITMVNTGKSLEVLDMKMNKEFYSQLTEAVNEGESPLIKESEERLIRMIKNKYDNLY